MADKIPSLWPEDAVAIDILSPLAILNVQAARLAQLTRGVLEAEVVRQEDGKGGVQLHFDVIAPALDGYRRRILTAAHGVDVYPVRLTPTPTYLSLPVPGSRSNLDALRTGAGHLVERKDYPPPSTEQEFLKQVGEVLSSSETKALLQSLIARSNERRAARETPPAA